MIKQEIQALGEQIQALCRANDIKYAMMFQIKDDVLFSIESDEITFCAMVDEVTKEKPIAREMLVEYLNQPDYVPTPK